MKIASSIKPLYDIAASSDNFATAEIALDFTEDILQIMEELGVSQADLAKDLEITTASMSNHLKPDGHNMTISTMVRISRALGASLQVKVDHPKLESMAVVHSYFSVAPEQISQSLYQAAGITGYLYSANALRLAHQGHPLSRTYEHSDKVESYNEALPA